ncbi:type II toxin-antitoxin system RelE family toxin [Rossellomorea yichunensis]|uniref:type II toxin-antitoxin system RelE family toxin n=1 Tax=Rossellomorea yichunensis TaxID=3077331 RepID=UPI0028E039D5|nr:type II toxin-antitoxin system RelE/ParE family toxin [Rossellomorea sp. YC4-1]MDT9027815.1 type II toxin-antitoxin system RelE/ParE family toxin [Rossellomorea sp. YC4-1]
MVPVLNWGHFIPKQEKGIQKRIADGLKGLLEIPPEGDIKIMKEYTDLYRLRIGTFRILFEIDHDEKIIYIQAIGKRGDIYK